MAELTIVSQYYYPEQAATAVLLHGIARRLVLRGMRVRVLCAQPAYHTRLRLPESETVDGVDITRIVATQWDKNNSLGRVSNTLTFTCSAAWRLALERSGGPVLLVTCPPQGLWIGGLLHALRGRPYYLLVHDVYPDQAERLGHLTPGGAIARLWRSLNRVTFADAERVVTLGPVMQQFVQRNYVPRERHDRVIVIHNWGDIDFIQPLPKTENPFVLRHGLMDRFVVAMSGNLGLFQEFDVILQSARALRDTNVLFLFIGEGGQKRRIARAAASLGNVRVLDSVPRSDLPLTAAAADAALISLKAGIEGLAVPSRLYTAMAAGTPVVAVMSEYADAALTLKEHDCGLCVGYSPQLLADTLLELRDNPVRREKLGRNGRRAVELHYGPDQIAEQYFQVFAQGTTANAAEFYAA